MIPPQQIPLLFKEYTDHLDSLLNKIVHKPCAWILSFDNTWTRLYSIQNKGHIEDLEYKILQCGHPAFLQYTVTLKPTQQDHCVIVLFNGNQFTHTIFQPQAAPMRWWIEEWTVNHLLRREV